MPELPEVETTRRGIAPLLKGARVEAVVVRQPRLRWPVPSHLEAQLTGRRLVRVTRRAKYLLFHFDEGTLILHLGMSGSLRVLPRQTPPQRHDHFDLIFENRLLRLRDPRRFGAVLWTEAPPETHPLLARLGPEPLDDAFDGDHLYRCSRGRKTPVKRFIMDAQVVVGVGNIYANEALFHAGIHPTRPCGGISRARYSRLAASVKTVLQNAIEQGGTTLRDFRRADGRPGYFEQALAVYGRAGAPCPRCQAPLKRRIVAQRATYYCGRCQR